MILHAGPDGGAHDVILNGLIPFLAWVALLVNAAVYWTRRALLKFRKPSPTNS